MQICRLFLWWIANLMMSKYIVSYSHNIIFFQFLLKNVWK